MEFWFTLDFRILIRNSCNRTSSLSVSREFNRTPFGQIILERHRSLSRLQWNDIDPSVGYSECKPSMSFRQSQQFSKYHFFPFRSPKRINLRQTYAHHHPNDLHPVGYTNQPFVQTESDQLGLNTRPFSPPFLSTRLQNLVQLVVSY